VPLRRVFLSASGRNSFVFEVELAASAHVSEVTAVSDKAALFSLQVRLSCAELFSQH